MDSAQRIDLASFFLEILTEVKKFLRLSHQKRRSVALANIIARHITLPQHGASVPIQNLVKMKSILYLLKIDGFPFKINFQNMYK